MEAGTAVLGLRQWVDYEVLTLVSIKYPTKQHSEKNLQQPTRMVLKLYLLGISLDLGNKVQSRITGLFRVCHGKFWDEVGLLLTPVPGTKTIIYTLLLPFPAHLLQQDFPLSTMSIDWIYGTLLDGKTWGRSLFRFRPFEQRNQESWVSRLGLGSRPKFLVGTSPSSPQSTDVTHGEAYSHQGKVI